MAGTIPAKRPPVHFQREWSPDRAPRNGIPEVCLNRRAGVATRVFGAVWCFGKATLVTSRRGGRGKVGYGKCDLPRHRRRSVAGAAAIIRPAAGSNIPEGLSSPACYCPLPGAGPVIDRVQRSVLDAMPLPGHPCAKKAQRWPWREGLPW